MANNGDNKPILLAEDDFVYYRVIQSALKQVGMEHMIHRVDDGEALVNYLSRSHEFSSTENYIPPRLVIADINMPRKSGLEALREIKAHPTLRVIPVVMLTNSDYENDITLSYEYGASSFITKPSEFGGLIKIFSSIHNFWFDVSTLPEVK